MLLLSISTCMILCLSWWLISYITFTEYLEGMPSLGSWDSKNPYWVNIFGGFLSLVIFLSCHMLCMPALIINKIMIVVKNLKVLTKLYHNERIDIEEIDTYIYSRYLNDKKNIHSSSSTGLLSVANQSGDLSFPKNRRP